MVDANPQVMCRACQAIFAVEPEWRIAQCPKCGEMVTRMGEDAQYD